MSYVIRDLREQIDRIKRCHPHTVAIAIDTVGDLKERALPSVLLMGRKGGNYRVDINVPAAVLSRSIERLSTNHGIGENASREIHEAAEIIHGMNSRGAWCLKTDNEKKRVDFNAATLAELDPDAAEFLEEQLQVLRDTLPGTSRIEVDMHRFGRADGRTSSRTWLRFNANLDAEQAAIDPTLLTNNIRDQVIGAEHKFLQANQVRMAHWARQLETDPMGLAKAFHAVNLFAGILHARSVDVRNEGV